VSVLGTLLEAARYRWIPFGIIYVLVMVMILVRYARPLLAERGAEDHEGGRTSSAWITFVAAIAVWVVGGVIALALTLVLYVALWGLNKVGI